MLRTTTTRRRAMMIHAIFALFVFAAGAAAHLKHHLDDPHCDGGNTTTHSCVCSGLHGGALTEKPLVVAPFARVRFLERVALDVERPIALAIGVRGARAPPLG
jgi:hypothetical protein